MSLGGEEETRPLSYPSLDDQAPAIPKRPTTKVVKEEHEDEISRELMAIE